MYMFLLALAGRRSLTVYTVFYLPYHGTVTVPYRLKVYTVEGYDTDP
jgi:hypothetical protein